MRQRRTYVGPGGADAGDVNADGADGVVEFKKEGGKLHSRGCVFALKSPAPDTWQVKQLNECLLADGVRLAGTYQQK